MIEGNLNNLNNPLNTILELEKSLDISKFNLKSHEEAYKSLTGLDYPEKIEGGSDLNKNIADKLFGNIKLLHDRITETENEINQKIAKMEREN